MNRLPKYWVVKNPNQVVKDYLAKTYNVTSVSRWNYNFIGFDGAKSYNGVHGANCLEYLVNDPAILTLDKFIELSKEVDEFVLPEKWYVEVSNELDSKEIQKYFKTNSTPGVTGKWFYRSDKFVSNREDTFVKGYTKITFEQFTKYVLKQDTMINFRIKGTKLPIIPAGNEYRVYNWPDTVPNNTLINSRDHISFGYEEYTGEIYILHEERSYCGSNFYMTKESDIIRLAKEQGLIKQDIMEKEIIGYKCPVDLFNGNIKKDWILFKDSDGNTYRPKGQGPLHALPKEIVETWEPVYKEEFKVGDWIPITGNVNRGWLVETRIRTFKITREKTQYSGGRYFGISGAGYKNSGLYTEARLATPEEIESTKTPYIVINTYEGEFFDDYVTFGCAEISKEVFIDLFTCKEYPNTNRDVESVTIGKGTFTKDQIEQIAEYYLNKK